MTSELILRELVRLMGVHLGGGGGVVLSSDDMLYLVRPHFYWGVQCQLLETAIKKTKRKSQWSL